MSTNLLGNPHGVSAPRGQDQVKPLHTLTGDMLTTAQVAEWYGVKRDAVAYHVKHDREELESNGYRSIEGCELREFCSLNRLPSGRHLAIWTRRAVLNVGMHVLSGQALREFKSQNVTLTAACPGESLQQELGKALSCELQLTVVPGRGIIPRC